MVVKYAIIYEILQNLGLKDDLWFQQASDFVISKLISARVYEISPSGGPLELQLEVVKSMRVANSSS